MSKLDELYGRTSNWEADTQSKKNTARIEMEENTNLMEQPQYRNSQPQLQNQYLSPGPPNPHASSAFYLQNQGTKESTGQTKEDQIQMMGQHTSEYD